MNKTKKKVNSKTRKYKHHIFKRKTRNNVKRRLKRKNRTIKGGTNMKEVILGQLKAIRFDKYNNNAIQLYDDDFWSGQLNPTIDTLIIPAITKLHTLETKYKQNKTSIEDMLIIGKQILIYKQASHCRREGEKKANIGTPNEEDMQRYKYILSYLLIIWASIECKLFKLKWKNEDFNESGFQNPIYEDFIKYLYKNDNFIDGYTSSVQEGGSYYTDGLESRFQHEIAKKGCDQHYILWYDFFNNTSESIQNTIDEENDIKDLRRNNAERNIYIPPLSFEKDKFMKTHLLKTVIPALNNKWEQTYPDSDIIPAFFSNKYTYDVQAKTYSMGNITIDIFDLHLYMSNYPDKSDVRIYYNLLLELRLNLGLDDGPNTDLIQFLVNMPKKLKNKNGWRNHHGCSYKSGRIHHSHDPNSSGVDVQENARHPMITPKIKCYIDKIVIFRLIDKLLNDFISNDNQQQLVDNKFKLDPEIKQQIKIKIIKDIVLEKIIEYTSRLSGNNIYLASLFKKGDKSHNLYKSQLSNIGTLDSKLIRIAFNMYDD